MSFIWPTLLILLIAIPLGIVLYIRLMQRRRRIVANFGSLGFVQAAAGQMLGLRRHIPPLLFLIGITILLIALARPETVVSLPRQEGTILLTFDVSGSMAAEDVPPSRLEAAKAAARDFIERQPRNIQIGVVAFSDSGFAVQAPTNDKDAILAAINRLAPQRGTSIGQAVLASLKVISADTSQVPRLYSNLTPTPLPSPTPVPQGTYTSSVIVLLSDGENNETPDPLSAAQAAIERGVRIYTVGIGSAAGTSLRVNGFTVHTQLDEAMLQQIAETTSGAYYSPTNQQNLHTIYDDMNAQLVVKPEKMEVTALFAGAGVLILLIGGICSLLWFSRLP
ncbi:MAG: VWA domain-containing protein [Roseiflexaceae bacterium]|nr:VWA domain-containing protein [Roseiflexaceae bacterium]